MKKIRIGNDFVFNWAIERGGLPEDLSSVLEAKLTVSVFGKKQDIPFTVSGNIITIEFTPEICNIIGLYNLLFTYILPDTSLSDEDRKCAVDIDAFQIVAKTAQADDSTEFSMTSDMAIAFKGDKGDSAYQVWLDAGNIGTEEDYFAYLQKPATDAIASIQAVEQTVSDNEALRVTAEQGRVDEELLRVGAESARSDAEGLRNENEIDRIEAEGIRNTNETGRINAESDRMDAEVLREQAEAAREEAEDLRQTNTTTAIQDAGEATTAANTAAGLATEAATTANTAAGDANDAATAANTAAGLADTARTELTTAVNTKLGEADAKIEEMDTTLSTYDGRVTQVESDISQLAGDVSLFKDEATVKLINLNTNGNFVNGTTGWAWGSNITGTSVTDGIFSFIGGGTIGASIGNWIKPPRGYTFPKGHVLFNIVTARSFAEATFYMGIGSGYSTFYLTDQWGTCSYLGKDPTTNAPTYGAMSGHTVEMTNAMCFDVTEIFGAGNEPTKEEVDLLISILGIDYFEGEVTIPTQKIMQWQLKLIRKNKNAIIALGGTII